MELCFTQTLKKVQIVKLTPLKLGTMYVIPNVGQLSPIVPLSTQKRSSCKLPGSGH